MQAPSTFSILAAALAVVFWVIGLIHLFGPRFLRDAFEKWNYGTCGSSPALSRSWRP